MTQKEINLAGQGGPDEETWKKMTPLAKRIYWLIVIVMLVMMFVALVIRFAR